MILAPAVLDGWRYFHPDAKWAVWTSRAVKVVHDPRATYGRRAVRVRPDRDIADVAV